MAIYTEQQAYQYLESISLSLEKIAKCLDGFAEAGIAIQLEMPDFVPPTPDFEQGSKSQQKLKVVPLGTPASPSTTAGSESKAESAPSAYVLQTQNGGSPLTTTTVPGNSVVYSVPSATPESSED